MQGYKIKTLYSDNKYLNLMETTCPDGTNWAYTKRVNTKGVVIIVPFISDTSDYSTIFLKTKRPPLLAENIAEFNIEFPAGLVADENSEETTLMALKKELLEETGLVADEFIIKNEKLSSSAGCVSEIATLAIAKISDSKIVSEPISDGDIIQDRIIVPITDIDDFLNECKMQGCAIGAQTLAGCYYLFQEVLSSHF